MRASLSISASETFRADLGLTLVVGGVLLRIVWTLYESVLTVGDVPPTGTEGALGGDEHVPEFFIDDNVFEKEDRIGEKKL